MHPSGPSQDLFQPLKKSFRSSELLAGELCRLIVEGKLKPGGLLPSERSLAEKFCVTRNTVREALRSLENLHLVSIRQGSRITVLDYLAHAGFDFVAELFSASDHGLDKLMDDIAQAWAVIGKAMMFFAVDNMAPAALDGIARAITDFIAEALKPAPDPARLQELDFEIQNRLMRGTGNQAMTLLHNSIRHIYSRVATLFAPIVGDPATLAGQYATIRESLASGDRATARDMFAAYFEQGREALSKK